MNNAVVITVYDRTSEQHRLTVSAVESALKQDIPVDLFILDNGSTYEPTREWLRALADVRPNVTLQRYEENISPIKLGNMWMGDLFNRLGYQHILGIPNDVILPSNLYREFLRWPRGIVTGSMTGEQEVPRFETSEAMNECTPMAVCLIRKWAYEALMSKDGYFFDERFFMYASDCDFALRIAACGIRGVQLDIQYWHYGSASHRLANAPGAYGANEDRQKFIEKWGFPVDAYEYGALAGDINFRGVGK